MIPACTKVGIGSTLVTLSKGIYMLGIDYVVCKASLSQCIKILEEPRLANIVAATSMSELLDFIIDHKAQFYVLSYRKYRTLFWYAPMVRGIYEVHVACPKDSIKACRVLLTAVIYHVATVAVPDCKGLVTSCPEGKIANTLRKLGCIQFNKVGETVHFSLPKESITNI